MNKKILGRRVTVKIYYFVLDFFCPLLFLWFACLHIFNKVSLYIFRSKGEFHQENTWCKQKVGCTQWDIESQKNGPWVEVKVTSFCLYKLRFTSLPFLPGGRTIILKHFSSENHLFFKGSRIPPSPQFSIPIYTAYAIGELLTCSW